MRTRLILLTSILAILTVGAVGCSTDRQSTYDKAMRSTISDLRSGDIDGAASTLEMARSHASGSDQKQRVDELGVLIDGAQAYCRGDRSQAAATWSSSKSPEFRRAITASLSSLGVTLSASNKN